MAVIRSPGVYYEPSEQRVPPLALGRTGVPVFLGLTRRGPLDRPVRIGSEARFVEIFGEPVAGSYLAAAVRGFFDNGGESCFVLRVARTEARGDGQAELAETAHAVLLDGAGNLSLRIEAQDPGRWGNGLSVAVTASAPTSTFLTRDADAGDDRITVKSTHGITPGSLVRLHTPEAEHHAVVARVEGRTLLLLDPLPAHFASARPTYVSALGFDLRVWSLERQERFEGLAISGRSPRYVERVINEQSRLIRVTALNPGTSATWCLPAPMAGTPLKGGADGLVGLGPGDFIGYDRGPGHRRGLMGLVDHPDIDLVCLPDLMAAWEQAQIQLEQEGPEAKVGFRKARDIEIVQDAAVTVCERAGNCFALLDMPRVLPGIRRGNEHEMALRWRQQYDSAHAALYFPWVVVLDPGRRAVPPCGHIAGIIAKSDKGYGVHKAPANEVVQGVVDLDVLLQDHDLADLNDKGVNCMRPFGPRGIRVWGARTLSNDPEWRFVNVRRTVSAIAAAIEAGTQWAVFEPNGPSLWKKVSRLVVGFLMDLREQGMLTGQTPEDAFFVQCDAETNPPDDVDRGMLTTRIGLAVTRPVEFIVFRLTQRLEDQAQSDEE
ncbi:MAG: phage tail sheath family protein [Myxococcales bacterium]|nr:phage tail sheath family protein [Myxococcales bacterium]MCB9523801.1 phage tail sheath family protein [Myxococcales bacterium]